MANNEFCSIDINGKEQIQVQRGQSLLKALSEEGIFIPSACGGRGICGYCKLKVKDGGGAILDTEMPLLTDQQMQDGIRLSCQVKVDNNISIEIPQELLAVRYHTCLCSAIVDLTYDIKLFRFELKAPDTLDYVPGQYIQLFTPVYFKGGEEVYRAYSIASDPGDKTRIELIIRRVAGGISTTYCFEHLKVGDEVKLNGPCGDFKLSDTEAPIIFIAGGSGMAPIRCILNEMSNSQNKRKVTYYFGVNKVRELFMLDEMEQFESQLEDFRFVGVVASPDEYERWDGPVGLVTEVVEKQLENASQCEAYLCGSPGMIEASGKVLKKLGVQEDKIYYDSFG